MHLECTEVATTVEVKSEAPVPTSYHDRPDLEPTNTEELAANNLSASHAYADWRFLRRILLTRLFWYRSPELESVLRSSPVHPVRALAIPELRVAATHPKPSGCPAAVAHSKKFVRGVICFFKLGDQVYDNLRVDLIA